MYTAIKHIHLLAIVLSISLLIFRFVLTLKGSELLQKKWLKITPHVVDTVLLLSAATLCVVIAQYPFVHAWLTEKLIAVIAYIFLGLVALKLAKNNLQRSLAFVGALAMLAMIGKLAVLKQPFILSI
ncbi:MAG: invasion protein [Alteromonadaceae bacterium]|nr:invasion protein [Alteromonadaceae bacterium]